MLYEVITKKLCVNLVAQIVAFAKGKSYNFV